jgi:hypothetical protein
MEIKFTDNNYKEFTAKIADEEIPYLLEFAIMELIKRGVLSIEDISVNEKQLQLKFLEDINEKEMFNG